MTKNRTADVDIVDILGVTETNVLILRLVSFGDHNIHKMPHLHPLVWRYR